MRVGRRAEPGSVTSKEKRPMELTELKAAVKNLSAEERRKLALYILELEKDHFQGTLGPQIVEDLEGLSKVVQEGVQKIKNYVKDSL
jgi:hypothetical protein